MAKATKHTAGSLPPETVERIRRSVVEGRGKSMFPADPEEKMPMFGVQCRCGVRRKPPGLARHVQDDGKCLVHPERPPESYVTGAGPGGAS